MSYPYPQDRNRDRKEKGEQPYKDARQDMAESEAELRQQAGEPWELDEEESEEARAARLRAEAEDRLKAVHEEGDTS